MQVREAIQTQQTLPMVPQPVSNIPPLSPSSFSNDWSETVHIVYRCDMVQVVQVHSLVVHLLSDIVLPAVPAEGVATLPCEEAGCVLVHTGQLLCSSMLCPGAHW